MYKSKVSDFGYNRIFDIIEYGHWLQIVFWEIFGQNKKENKAFIL